jgi:hypothetical protein
MKFKVTPKKRPYKPLGTSFHPLSDVPADFVITLYLESLSYPKNTVLEMLRSLKSRKQCSAEECSKTP